MRVALGLEPADLAIVNASIVNVYTGEIIENCSVAVKGKWIAAVGPGAQSATGESTTIIDASGKTLIPGLIDGHTHSWHFTPYSFLPYAIKGGATTIIIETMEYYPVAGYEGVIEFLDSLKDQPIKVLATAPAMVSTSRTLFGIPSEDLEKLLRRDDIVGLGESYWQSVLQTPEILVPILQRTIDHGKYLEGHSAGARGNKLMAYAAAGISSCHEPINVDEVIERLRLGIYVMIREGSVRKELPVISEIRNTGVDLRRMILVTDSIEPEELVEKGYLEAVVQRAIDYGFDPISAIRMATLNVAERFGLDDAVGGIAPGRCADILMLPDVRTIAPEIVISNGRVIYEGGKVLQQPRRHSYPDHCFKSVRLDRKFRASDFEIRPENANKGPVTVRVIEMMSDLVTAESHLRLSPVEGKLQINRGKDILKVAAIERRNNPGRAFVGLIKGFGMKKGAMACSASWDTSDIVVVGADEIDMALAVNRVHELQGGLTVCRDGQVIAEVGFPIFGIVTDSPIIGLAEELRAVRLAARELGVGFPDPTLTLATLTGAAIPFFRICDEGLVNLRDGKTRTLEVT